MGLLRANPERLHLERLVKRIYFNVIDDRGDLLLRLLVEKRMCVIHPLHFLTNDKPFKRCNCVLDPSEGS